MNNSSIFIITTFSPYEEIYKNNFRFKIDEKALKKGYSDLWESGSNGNPSIACIEEYRPGFNIQISFKRCFYSCYFNRIRKNNNLFIKIKVKKIKEPKWAKGTTNFALG